MNITNKILITIVMLTIPKPSIEQNLSPEISPAGDNWQMVEFNLTNPSTSPVVVDLFDVNGLATPIPSNPNSLPPTNIVDQTSLSGQPSGTAVCNVTGDTYVGVLNTVQIIDRNSYLVTVTITGFAGNLDIMVYNSNDNTMYVTCAGFGRVYVISCTTNTIIATILTGGASGVTGIGFNSLDNTIYVGLNDVSGNVLVIDCLTNTITATVSTLGTDYVGTFAYCVNNNTMYVPDFGSSNVYVIDCATNVVTATVTGIGTQAHSCCYNTLQNQVYVTAPNEDDVYVIDCSTNTLTASSPIAVGSFPRPLVFDFVNNQVYVCNFLAGTITAIACDTETVFGTISGISTPIAIAYNIASNGLFVSHTIGLTGTMTIVAPFQTFYITSSSFDYNQFVRDQGINPKIVRQIVLLTTAEQLNNNIQILQKDMYGKIYIDNRIPNLQVSKFMNQNTIAELDFSTKNNQLILDVYTSFASYTINANTTLIMLLYYKEAIMAEKLNRNGKALQGTCINMEIQNCSQDATLKLGEEIPNFGEPVITIEEVLKQKK